jgi:hypothetical protein
VAGRLQSPFNVSNFNLPKGRGVQNSVTFRVSSHASHQTDARPIQVRNVRVTSDSGNLDSPIAGPSMATLDLYQCSPLLENPHAISYPNVGAAGTKVRPARALSGTVDCYQWVNHELHGHRFDATIFLVFWRTVSANFCYPCMTLWESDLCSVWALCVQGQAERNNRSCRLW